MSTGKKIIRNTGILYVKMGVTMLISLFSTRVILMNLGVEDFGIFSLVGGIISMFGFLNAAMASASQRFMSVAEGTGVLGAKHSIFNSSLLLHIIIIILLSILLLVSKNYIITSVLNIQTSKISSVFSVYHSMVLTAILSILSVPYIAVLNTRENMLFFSIVDILQTVLKLLLAISLPFFGQDKLYLYSVGLVGISIFVTLIYVCYCYLNYEECKIGFKDVIKKDEFIKMIKFAGWNFFGYASGMIGLYGQGILLNMFFGPLLNAASGIATQIYGQASVLSSTLLKAANPSIDKSEGAGNRKRMLDIVTSGCKSSFFLFSLITLPAIFEMDFILEVWLGNTPRWTATFCRFVLIKGLMDQMIVPIGSAIGAQGEIKNFNLIIALNNISPLAIIYFLFLNGYPPYTMYLVAIVFYSILNGIIHLYFAKKNIQFNIKEFIWNVVLRMSIILFVASILPVIIILFLDESFMRLIILTLFTSIVFTALMYVFGLEHHEKQILRTVVCQVINRMRIINISLRLRKP